MRVVMCKPRFIDKIKDGIKVTTMRVNARCLVGDVLSIRVWEGRPYRSKQREIYRTEVRDVARVMVTPMGVWLGDFIYEEGPELEKIAAWEGFENWEEMRAFFEETHGLPFRGEMISWRAI